MSTSAPKLKRFRNRKWSVAEISELINGYAHSYALLSSQATDAVTLDGKDKAYNAICDAVNAVGGADRDVIQIKVKWSNESCRVKRLLATKWRAMERDLVPLEEQSGRLFSDLNDFDRRIAMILPPDSYKHMQVAFEGVRNSSYSHSEPAAMCYVDGLDSSCELAAQDAYSPPSPLNKPLMADEVIEQHLSGPTYSPPDELVAVERERLAVEKDIVSELRLGNSLRQRLVAQNEQIIKLLLSNTRPDVREAQGTPAVPIVIPTQPIKREDERW